MTPLDGGVAHEFGDANPDLVTIDPETGVKSCPFGLVLLTSGGDGDSTAAAGCRVRPRADYEGEYAKSGGWMRRVEPLPVLYSRMQSFTLHIQAADLEKAGAAAAAAAAASYTAAGQEEGGEIEVTPQVAALAKLNRLLQSNTLAAAASAQSKGRVPIPTALLLEVVLPGLEQPAQTTPAVFDGAGAADVAPWLRVAMVGRNKQPPLSNQESARGGRRNPPMTSRCGSPLLSADVLLF